MLTFKLNTHRQTINKRFASTEKSPISSRTNRIRKPLGNIKKKQPKFNKNC